MYLERFNKFHRALWNRVLLRQENPKKSRKCEAVFDYAGNPLRNLVTNYWFLIFLTLPSMKRNPGYFGVCSIFILRSDITFPRAFIEPEFAAAASKSGILMGPSFTWPGQAIFMILFFVRITSPEHLEFPQSLQS